MVRKLFIFTLISLAICDISCREEPILENDLSLKRMPYENGHLRIDGYYYTQFDETYRIYFLYHNGTVLSGGNVLLDELENQEESYANGDFWEAKQAKQSYWGVFQVNGKRIEIEKWYPSSGEALPVFLHRGEIQNDSTFVMTKSIETSASDEEKPIHHTYHFRKFSLKPDSTNDFIK